MKLILVLMCLFLICGCGKKETNDNNSQEIFKDPRPVEEKNLSTECESAEFVEKEVELGIKIFQECKVEKWSDAKLILVKRLSSLEVKQESYLKDLQIEKEIRDFNTGIFFC